MRVARRHAGGSVGKALALLSRPDVLGIGAEDGDASGLPDALGRVHRRVVGALREDRATRAAAGGDLERRLQRWSDLLFLAGAQGKFNLDRGQLAIGAFE